MAERFRMAFVGAGSRANQVHYPAFADLKHLGRAFLSSFLLIFLIGKDRCP